MTQDHKQFIGMAVEIPVHYDRWMQGARFGVVTGFRRGKSGQSDYLYVRSTHPSVRRSIKVWRGDWPYMRVRRGSWPNFTWDHLEG